MFSTGNKGAYLEIYFKGENQEKNMKKITQIFNIA